MNERVDYSVVTELSGDEVSGEQIDRISERYLWAGSYCKEKDVVEIACGSGQGLGYLQRQSKTLIAGDLTLSLLKRAKKHYEDRISLICLDGEYLPIKTSSVDCILLFEAIYYLPSAQKFVEECRRVLKGKGQILISTANKDLFDFNPSPFSQKYYGVSELFALFEKNGFSCNCFGNTPVSMLSWRQKILRPIKNFVVRMNWMPKTMSGKKLLKRLVFGKLVPMPAEIEPNERGEQKPVPLPVGRPNTQYKVIYCVATLKD